MTGKEIARYMEKAELKEFIQAHKRDWIVVLATVFFTIVLIGVFSFFSSPASSDEVFVPDEFLLARKHAASAATELADLTGDAAVMLEKIRDADRAGNFARGIQIAREAVNLNSDIREVTVSLSQQLRYMADNLGDVSPEPAQAVGVEAITAGLQLAQRLVDHNNYTYELLQATQSRLQTGGEAERERIDRLITLMNEEAVAVNNLNKEYRSLMLQFDELTRTQ